MSVFSKSSLFVVLAIALICILRFGFFYDAYIDNPALVIDPDTKSYVDISTAIYENGRYERISGVPEVHRPPGYPLFLAFNYALFGQGNLLAPVIIQHFLFFAMMLMVAYLAHQLGGPPALGVAALLYALDFTSFYYVNEVLSEMLFTFFIVLATVISYSAVKSRNRQNLLYFLTGLTLTMAVFVRPVGMFLMYPSAILIAAVSYLDSKDISDAVKSAVAFFIPWLVLGGSWYFYSFSVTGNFTFTSYESAVFDQRLVAVLKTSLSIDQEAAAKIVSERMSGAESPLRSFFAILVEHPWAAIKETITDIGRQLLSPGQWYLKFYLPTLYENQFPLENLIFTSNYSELAIQLAKRPVMYLPVILLVLLHLVVIYLGVLWSITGVRKLSFENAALIVILLMIIGYFVGITIGFIGHSRFRVPFMPALTILSGYGFSLIFKRRQSELD